MSVGFGLIRKMLEDDFSPAQLGDLGVADDYFIGNEERVIEFVKIYYTRYGNLPSVEVIQLDLDLEVPSDFPEAEIGYWADRVRERHVHNRLVEGVRELVRLTKNRSYDDAMNHLSQLYRDIASEVGAYPVESFEDLADQVLERHGIVRDAVGLYGVDLAFPYLNEVSGGAQRGDLIVMAGRPERGKTFIVLRIVKADMDQQKRVLFVSMEMPPRQCAGRLMALKWGIPHSQIKHGRVSDFGIRKLRDGLFEIRGAGGSGVHFMAGGLAQTTDELTMRIKEIRPDIVFVDGAYMMRPPRGMRVTAVWERVMAVTEELKRGALTGDIPIFGTFQHSKKALGKRGGELPTIAYSDAVGQIASLVMSLEEEEDEEISLRGVSSKILKIIKGRDGESGKIRISFDMHRTAIEQLEVLERRD